MIVVFAALVQADLLQCVCIGPEGYWLDVDHSPDGFIQADKLHSCIVYWWAKCQPGSIDIL